ncbi:MAG: class II aldolase/adducin family protein [Christensenellales bacterium]|jgi:L-fuculose-phosphate aldolase
MMLEQVQKDVLKAARLLYERGLVNTYEGNVSARIGDIMVITPSQVCKADLTADDLVHVDIETGRTVRSENGRRPSSEMKMHLACYRTRRDIRGVAHAHPAYATSFALRREKIATKGYPEMMLLYGEVPVCRYGRPSTDDVNRDVPAVLETYNAFLLASHGLCAVGASAIEAAYRLEGIESVAKLLTIVRQAGGEIELSDEECRAIEEMRRENFHKAARLNKGE